MPEVGGSPLFAAEESIRCRVCELRDELRIVLAVGRLPVHAAQLLAPPADRRAIDAEQRSRSDRRPELQIRLCRPDVADGNGNLVELASPEFSNSGERCDAAKLHGQACLAHHDEPLRPADELERAGNEARRRGDCGERVWEAAPFVRKLDGELCGGWRADPSPGEEPTRGCVEPLDAPQRSGDRRGGTTGEGPAAEVGRSTPSRTETRNHRTRSRIRAQRGCIEGPRECRLVATLCES